MTRVERVRPFWVAAAIFLAAAALCGPWGNYPLYDDWQYSRTAKAFAGTGRIVVDTPVAPALVGQTLLAAPVILIFGFSHTALRLLTLALAVLGLWCVDRLLRFAACPAGVRLFAVLVLALNPLFFCLSATFMTEIYGLVPVLLAAVVWFRGRERSPDGPAIGAGPALLAGALAGASFWTRQSCVVWFAALIASTFLTLALDRSWARLRRSILPLGMAAGLCGLMIALYFRWTRWSGNVRSEFTGPWATLATFDGRAWALETIVFVVYMSFFLAPLLLQVRVCRPWWWQGAWVAALLTGSWLASRLLAAPAGGRLAGLPNLAHSFPYLDNVFYDTGLGPLWLPTWAGLAGTPHVPGFEAVHVLSIVAVGFCGLLAPRLVAFARSAPRHAVELFLFGAGGAALSLATVIQAFHFQIADRYHLPGVLGGVLALGAFLGCDAAGMDAPGTWLRRAGVVVWLALSLFSVAALHDYFRWNDARWTLVREFLDQGHPPPRLYGGIEAAGWLNYDAWLRKEPPSDGGPAYHCSFPFTYCIDDTWVIAMTRPPYSYRVVRSLQPPYWLTPGRFPVALYERD